MTLKYRLGFVLFLLVIGLWVSGAQNCYDKPSQTGPCKGAFPSWRYIKEKRLCEPFLYGGCQATQNIFDDERECRQFCVY